MKAILLLVILSLMGMMEAWRVIQVTVRVPRPLRKFPPFNIRRTLFVPVGHRIELYTRLVDARFLLALPNSDVLVSQPWDGKILLLRKQNNVVRTFEFASKLQLPHDMVLYNINGTDFIYISESNQVARYKYHHGSKRAGPKETIVFNLTDHSSPELKGGYMHALKNIAIHDDRLYVSIASATNDDPADLQADPKRGAIYVYSLDGDDRELFAEGIRNAEGLAFAPNTSDLWVVVNQRDNVKYPFLDDTGNYGKQIQAFVDDNPPEDFIRVVKGGNYGWPYCIAIPTESMDNLIFTPDSDRNPNETVVNCSTMNTIDKGIDAHSAPLGLTFWTGSNIPSQFHGGAVVALHGSWNRRTFSGHKVVFFPWVDGRPGTQVDLVSGWLTKTSRWGRPVDTAVMPDGSLLISDDWTGAIYRLYRDYGRVHRQRRNKTRIHHHRIRNTTEQEQSTTPIDIVSIASNFTDNSHFKDEIPSTSDV